MSTRTSWRRERARASGVERSGSRCLCSWCWGGAGALWWNQGRLNAPEASKSPAAKPASTEATGGEVESAKKEENAKGVEAEPAIEPTESNENAAAPTEPEPAEQAKGAEPSPSALDEQAEETAKQEAAAAIDEELESEQAALDEQRGKKADKKASKRADKETTSSGASYEALMRSAKKMRKKQPSKALALYKQALAKRPRSVEALSNTGKLQLKAGKTSDAIATFKRCRKAMPRYTPCMYWHGRALEKSGRRSEAKKAYENYLDVNPDGSQSADVRRRLSR